MSYITHFQLIAETGAMTPNIGRSMVMQMIVVLAQTNFQLNASECLLPPFLIKGSQFIDAVSIHVMLKGVSSTKLLYCENAI
jgi:hypothetical protein